MLGKKENLFLGRDICLKFHNTHNEYFFKNLTLECTKNTIHVLHGRNGVGKSTIFRILQGKFLPGEFINGAIECDKVLVDLTHKQTGVFLKKHVQSIPQKIDLMLAHELTVRDHLMLARVGKYPGVRGLSALGDRSNFLEHVGVSLDVPVSLLSGGQKQLVALAMAIQRPVKLLLLDEPTAALDTRNARLIMNFLEDLVVKESLSVLMISHDQDIIKRYNQTSFELIFDKITGARKLI